MSDVQMAGWAGESGRRWLGGLDCFEQMIEPVGQALLDHAGFVSGERVADIGCGGGWTSRQIAALVGPQGQVTGLDISADLIAMAQERARQEGIENLHFLTGDAAISMPENAPFDRLFSRFGTMFFDDPVTAFTNMRAMLRSGGRFDNAVWASLNENPWTANVMTVVKRHVDLPVPVKGAPGPFSLGNKDHVTDIMTQAGFVDIAITSWEGLQYMGGPQSSPEDAAEFVLHNMQIGGVAKTASPAQLSMITADLVSMFRDYQTERGVAITGKAYLISAVVN